MKVVSNSTPLIFLAKIGKLGLLEKLFEVVLIPNKVFTEVVVEGKIRGYSDSFMVEKFIEKRIIQIREIKIGESPDIPIGSGELEAIELAVKMKIKDILIDETKGRRIARLYDLKPKGTLWILTKAFEDEIITKDELKNSISELIKSGYRIREEILIEIYNQLM